MVRRLFEQQRWDEVVQAVRSAAARNADLEYYHGVALAQQGRWAEAEGPLIGGHRLAPNQERFLIELGGVAFKQKRYRQAAQWLRRAIRISPDDGYANDFLGTIYFIQGNVEAALKYWNRSGKPHIATIQLQPGLRINPELLDRAFTFTPDETLLLADLRTTRARIAGLGVFSNYGFRLEARPDRTFDVTFDAREHNGWGASRWEALLSTLRGVAYQTIYPEYFNVDGAAVSLRTMVRWDAQKQRAQATVSGPLRRHPEYVYSIGFDTRRERWDLRSLSASLGGFRLRRHAIAAGLSSSRNGHWLWSSGGELSYRDYRGLSGDAALEPSIRLSGYQLRHTLQVTRDLWRYPEERMESSVQFSADTGRIWASPSRAFERLQLSARVRWIPVMTGSDYAVGAHLRAGRIFGQVPFDEMFILGLERDNDLWMRAHIGTRDGRKGSAPMGREYLLSNWEIDKNVYNDGLLDARLSPFLDAGRITGERFEPGSGKWLCDTGLQAKLRVLGVGFTVIYGKDLRSGNNTFYVVASR